MCVFYFKEVMMIWVIEAVESSVGRYRDVLGYPPGRMHLGLAKGSAMSKSRVSKCRRRLLRASESVEVPSIFS